MNYLENLRKKEKGEISTKAGIPLATLKGSTVPAEQHGVVGVSCPQNDEISFLYPGASRVWLWNRMGTITRNLCQVY